MSKIRLNKLLMESQLLSILMMKMCHLKCSQVLKFHEIQYFLILMKNNIYQFTN